MYIRFSQFLVKIIVICKMSHVCDYASLSLKNKRVFLFCLTLLNFKKLMPWWLNVLWKITMSQLLTEELIRPSLNVAVHENAKGKVIEPTPNVYLWLEIQDSSIYVNTQNTIGSKVRVFRVSWMSMYIHVYINNNIYINSLYIVFYTWKEK